MVSLRKVVWTLLMSSLVALGCSNGTDGSSVTADDGENELKTVAHCEQTYAAPLRAKMITVREELGRSRARYAADVLHALDDGVKVVPFCSMTPDHFEHFSVDTDLSTFGATPEQQYHALRAGETRGMKAVHDQLYGYMWDRTVYMASNMDVKTTLIKLAHEVRHVLRKASIRNFNDQRVCCVEELEAARAEVQVLKDEITPAEDRKLLDDVQELYELDKLTPGTCGYR